MGERQYEDDGYEEQEPGPRGQTSRLMETVKGDSLPHEEEESHTMKQLRAVGIDPRFVTDGLDDNAQLIVNQLLYKLNKSQLDLDHEKAQHELTMRQLQSQTRKRAASAGEGDPVVRPLKKSGQRPAQAIGNTAPHVVKQGQRPAQIMGESTPQYLDVHYPHRHLTT